MCGVSCVVRFCVSLLGVVCVSFDLLWFGVRCVVFCLSLDDCSLMLVVVRVH